ncbi:hypothetical protein [Caulobacter sp. 17J80-11]|uniref:hypothetical protein n=1 Tax=Caulobacter sp. 17J80-11 TaxID=2763502 RepID=UPI001653DA44|nr:hypothetical protein [Caulobacter sp. 17J80-11]MBC6980365.1 hypothetical protein [Caulobacter sp. 17J80-11]
MQADIDCGLTGEKVAVFDPAASPLGTDEEAGGTPASAELLGEERRRARISIDLADPSQAAIDTAKKRGVSPALVIAAAALALGAAAAVAMFG